MAVIDFVRHLVVDEGGDMSGRWLAQRLPNGATYYRERLSGEKLFTTNDITELAELFDMSPQGFVRAAAAFSDVDH